MSSFGAALAAFLVSQSSVGSSVYSFEPEPSCGSSASSPSCALSPVCSTQSVLCAPPRWNTYRGTWVRHERKSTGELRVSAIVEQLVSTAGRLVTCRRADGDVDFDCTPVRWGGGKGQSRELSLFAATVALHESGLREDVEIGAPPVGRGPAGEVCLMQIMPDQVAGNALWLSREERAAAASSKAEQTRVAESLLGSSPEALARCFEVGMRALARARSQCGKLGDAGTFAAYGTGGRCGAASAGWVTDRVRTLTKMRAALSARPAAATQKPSRG